MIQAVGLDDVTGNGARARGRWIVWFFQILFAAVLLLQVDEPFLSAHNERQNETFDMARHVCRDGWRSVLTPKVSYSWRDDPARPYTPMLMEVPFHGLISWPLTMVTSHDRAVVRLISATFALASIELLYWLLLLWVSPLAAAAGAGCWAVAPLVLHFGQVPMPDILSLAALLLAFWFAQKDRLAASSGCFLFSLLAKASSIVFGLPVLVALVVAQNCRTKKQFIRTAILWGWLPLLGIVAWEYLLNHFAPKTEMTLAQIMETRGGWSNLIKPSFYKFVIGCLIPMGVGALGFLGLLFAMRGRARMNPWVKGAIFFSNAFFFLFVVRKVPEPQYMLLMLVWGAMGAAFGFEFLLVKWRTSGWWRMGLGAVALVHLLVAIFFTMDLKESRVPSYPEIEQAAKLLPPGARVMVLYRFYGASPAIWLDRNVIPIGSKMPSLFPSTCEMGYRAGFTHLLILDIESLHDNKTGGGPLAIVKRVLNPGQNAATATANGSSATGFTSATSPYREYCDLVMTKMFDEPRVLLYSMAPLLEKKPLGEKVVWPGPKM
jgi:hypothetical protein